MTLNSYPNNNLFGDHPLFPRTPLREWIRRYIPSPQEGYVAEDLDLIFLRYGKAVGRGKNADGKFILCEWKLRSRELPYSQQRVFGLVDRLLRLADPVGEFYQGFYHISWDGQGNILFLNGQNITQGDFQAFLMGELVIKPFSFMPIGYP